MSESTVNLDFVSGRGDMAERIQAFDWSRTAIGAPEGWSHALQTTVRILLANGLPMLLWWGPDYISIYNDAYRPILGIKHPWALGRPVRECWSEIWSVLKPLIDKPFYGGPATWIEDIELFINRSGFTEETHFTVAYSPVPDETVSGGIGGVLATVHEITGKVIGERRVGILRELGTRAVQAKTPEQACILAAKTLARHPKDIPFALVYLLDEREKEAKLAAAAGAQPGDAIVPSVLALDEETGQNPWLLALAHATGHMQVVENLPEGLSAVPPGPWPESPDTAVVVPIRSTAVHRSAGFLVAGISSRLRLDEQYRNFLELTAGQIESAVMNAQAYEEERKRADLLAELDRAKTVFFSNVSHEFRTPLTLMRGPLEDTLARTDNLLPEDRERLEMVRRNSMRLTKLVNTLLDFSRIEAGRIQSIYEPTDLAAFTAELASSFRSAIERVGMELKVNCSTLSTPVYVDRDMWEKIVLNLLSNAFKFTFKGEIEVSLRQVGEAAELAVRDTGTGIPAQELPRLFDRFHRVKGARGRTFEGSGIGLALVHELVKLHGGEIRVESEVDAGSRFAVSIPLGAAHLPAGRIQAERNLHSTATRADAFVEEALRWLPQDSGQAERGALLAAQTLEIEETVSDDLSIAASRRPHVLLADDNTDMREYVQRLLSRLYDVTAVANGAAALQSAREHVPDLLLTDVMMPGLDGFALLREWRAGEHTREVPVILLSARAGEESRIEGLEAGADDYLTKPFSAKELLARVEASLRLQRVRAEAREIMAKSEERYRTLVSVLTDVPWIADAAGAFNEPQPAWEAYTGQSWDRHRGLGWIDAIHPDDRGQVKADLELACRTRRPRHESYGRMWHAPTQEWRHVAARIAPVLLPDGSVREWVGACTDIEEWKRTDEALRASESRFRAIVEQATAGISQTDLDGRFILVNDRYCEMTGYSREELIGSRPHDITHPEDRAQSLASFRQMAAEGRSYAMEKRYIRKDGSTVWVRNTVSAILDAAGRPQCASAVTIDITERKRWEEELKEANADLEQFAYSASHDLQEPLRAVSIYSQLVAKRYGDRLDAQAFEYLGYLRNGAMRMERLVRDLLAYTQVMRAEPAAEISDGNEALHAALTNLREAVAESGAKITSDPLPPVPIRGAHLQQVFQNLIGNAIKYRSQDHPPAVHISAERQDGAWAFSVNDNGIGIDPEYKEQIFGVFKRLHTNDEYSGTGIGLAICQRIVERYHGRIWVQSEPGKGSTFRFTLPA